VRRMTAARRWALVGLGVLLLVAAPFLVRAVPAHDDGTSAVALLHRIQGSRDVAFSGYVESGGSVGLPANDVLSGLTKLVGDTNKVRVWWRDPTRWRVSTLRTTGETDLVRTGNRMLRWVYESKNVTSVPDVAVRLPDTADLLPNELARRALSGARSGEVSRLPARRIAGRDALGLRLRPADPQASIARVDVYADPATGLPVQVQLFGRGARTPSVTSRFLDLSIGTPSSSALAFSPPADAHLRSDDVVDLADAANRFASRVPPKTLAGLPQRAVPVGQARGAVGVYGRGPTLLLAVPLWHRSADRVREDLVRAPGTREIDAGVLVAAPPLRLLLADAEPSGSAWLLAGTVTRTALVAAAEQLAAHRPGLSFR
jgi:outer membrane lipoprotein-sorting protein